MTLRTESPFEPTNVKKLSAKNVKRRGEHPNSAMLVPEAMLIYVGKVWVAEKTIEKYLAVQYHSSDALESNEEDSERTKTRFPNRPYRNIRPFFGILVRSLPAVDIPAHPQSHRRTDQIRQRT